MTVFLSSQTESDANWDLDLISTIVKKQDTDDRIQQLIQRIEVLEKIVLESQVTKQREFYDLTALAEKVVPCTVKITANYNFHTLYEEDLIEGPVFGYGSGCVISQDGYILTNFHVVNGSSSLSIYNNFTGQFYDAEICQVDPNLDLALIKIEAEDLPYFDVGDSDLMRPGDFVVLTGNPLGFKNLLTLGMVGSVAQGLFNAYEYGWQEQDVGRFADYLISDAVCNPGNSGGPLINFDGQLVGIASRGGEGLGLAITSNTALQFLASIQENGRLFKNVFAAELSEITLDDCEYFNLPEEAVLGAMIVELGSKSLLTGAGLEKGDVIIRYNDTDFISLEQFYYDLARTVDIGVDLEVEVFRGNTKMQFLVPLDVQDVYRLSYLDDLGIKVQALQGSLAVDLDLDSKVSGIVIFEVEKGSNADLAGLIPGDVIVGVLDPSFQQIPIHSVDEFQALLETLKDKNQMYLQVVSKYFNKTLIVPIRLD